MIKAGTFTIPGFLDKSVASLIRHMLVTDPLKRATVQDIRNHAWFAKDCPDYLFPHVTSETSILDMEVVSEAASKFGVEEEEIQFALLSEDPQNKMVMAYNVIIDNKRSELGREDHLESKLISENIWREVGIIKRSKWNLGIQSQSKPQEIMIEVFKAMKMLDFEWKVFSPYHVHVRRKYPAGGQSAKMSLQLYQVGNKTSLLDFKCLLKDENTSESMTEGKTASENHTENASTTGNCGPNADYYTMQFFEMCAALINQLAK